MREDFDKQKLLLEDVKKTNAKLANETVKLRQSELSLVDELKKQNQKHLDDIMHLSRKYCADEACLRTKLDIADQIKATADDINARLLNDYGELKDEYDELDKSYKYHIEVLTIALKQEKEQYDELNQTCQEIIRRYEIKTKQIEDANVSLELQKDQLDRHLRKQIRELTTELDGIKRSDTRYERLMSQMEGVLKQVTKGVT